MLIGGTRSDTRFVCLPPDDELELVLPRIKEIPWRSAVGRRPRSIYAESVCEHRWLDPVRQLDFSELDGEVAYLAERAASYYEAAAMSAALLARARS